MSGGNLHVAAVWNREDDDGVHYQTLRPPAAPLCYITLPPAVDVKLIISALRQFY